MGTKKDVSGGLAFGFDGGEAGEGIECVVVVE